VIQIVPRTLLCRQIPEVFFMFADAEAACEGTFSFLI